MKKLFINPTFELISTGSGVSYKDIGDESFTEIPYVLDNQDVNIDQSLEDKILQEIKNETFDIFCIPINLDDSVINFDGIRLGMHTRLTEELGNKRFKPIVFLGELTPEQINKINPVGRFLFSKGVYYCQNNKESIVNFLNKNNQYLEEVDETYIKEELSEWLYIPRPSHLGSHHALSNEWGALMVDKIGKYKTLDEKDERLKELKQNLYFKSLNIKSFYNSHSIEKEIKDSKNKKILYIDDEAEKGWVDILNKLIYNNGSNQIDVLSISKGQSQKDIVKQIINKVQNEDWDLILLDLRLNDEDHYYQNQYPNYNYTGLKALKEIKNINKGFQIIIFTASTKAWNYQRLTDLNADGLFIKPNPLFDNEESIKHKLEEFISNINECFEKGFLKDIFEKLQQLEKKSTDELNRKPKNKKLSINENILEKSKIHFNSVDKLLNIFYYDLKWAFSSLMLLIEDIILEYYYKENDEHVVPIDLFNREKCKYKKEGSDDFYLRLKPSNGEYLEMEYRIEDENDRKKYEKNEVKFMPFNYRLTCVLRFRYNKELEDINKFYEIYRLRSKAVSHSGNEEVKPRHIVLMLDLLDILIS